MMGDDCFIRHMAKLVVITKGLTVLPHELGDKWTTIGRAEGNTFLIPDASISARHCETLVQGDDLIVRDLQSTNGTFAAGRKISEGVVKSGQTGMDKVGTLRWLAATAQARMDNLLSAYYSDGSRVDGVLSPYDGLSRGITASARAVGYGTDSQPWPIVTGQDSETASVKLIISGEQYSTIFKDTRLLAAATVKLVDTVLSGKTPDGLDTKSYNNGKKVVPAILLTPYAVDKSNYQKLVVDSGYIKADDLK